MQKTIIAVLLSTISALIPAAQSQTRGEREKAVASLHVDSGAARWRETPVDSNTQIDEVSTSLRDQRNEYWQTHLPPANGHGTRGFPAMGAPEVDPRKEVVWITGVFSSYKVFEAGTGYGTYTEIRFRVTDLIANRTAAHLSAEQLIDVGEPGGSLRMPDGTTKTYNLRFVPYPPQPEHSYLLELNYNKSGDFFLINKMWDISSGYALPAGVIEAGHYIDGDAVVGGLSSAEAVAKVRATMQAASPEANHGR